MQSETFVLNNWRRHGKDAHPDVRHLHIDPFSSAGSFSGWTTRRDYREELSASLDPLPVSRPQTWLLSVGWTRHGLIGLHEVPGPRIRQQLT